jgi:hypothetical protein
MATLAEMLRQGADRLVNLPSEAQRFVTNPQAFTQLLTGKNPLPRETGFAAGATGLPAQEMSVLDPNQAPYMQGYTQGEPVSYAGMALPAYAAALRAKTPNMPKMPEGVVFQNLDPTVQAKVKSGMIAPADAQWMSDYARTSGNSRVETGTGMYKDQSEKMQNYLLRIKNQEVSNPWPDLN